MAVIEHLGGNLRNGYLFRPTNSQGAIVNESFTSSAAKLRLRNISWDMMKVKPFMDSVQVVQLL